MATKICSTCRFNVFSHFTVDNEGSKIYGFDCSKLAELEVLEGADIKNYGDTDDCPLWKDMIPPLINAWTYMTDAEKIYALIYELEKVKEVAQAHYREHRVRDYKKSATSACTWITNEINGVLEIVK